MSKSALDSKLIGTFNPIYLHYLDRELREAVGNPLPIAKLESITRLLLLGTPGQLYCGLSPAWEGTSDRQVAFFSTILQHGHLDLLSHHPDINIFVTSKASAYQHDTARYPMYFGGAQEIRLPLRPTRIKTSSATDELKDQLYQWSLRDRPRSDDEYFLPLIDKSLKTSVRKSIEARTQEAITFAMFRPTLAVDGLEKDVLATGYLRREISADYLDHYLNVGGGDIATGISNLEVFDRRARYFPFHDVEFFWSILSSVGLGGLARGADQILDDEFLAIRGGINHRYLAMAIKTLLAGLFGMVPAELVAIPGKRYTIRGNLDRLLFPLKETRITAQGADGLIANAYSMLLRAIQTGRSNAHFAMAADVMKEVMMKDRERVVLVTATQVEIENAVKLIGGSLSRHHIGDHTYYRIGTIGGCDVFAVKSSMGSGGPSGSQATVTDAIREIQPSAVIMVGIAFGLQKDKQSIGDVLISRELQPYEPQRIGQVRISRNPRVQVSPRILDRFESGAIDFKVAKVHIGLLLSGEKLVDSSEFRKELLALAPEAIGGEMEAAGLYAAAFKDKVDWIVVKAIADWGEGKTSDHQAAAAGNALQYVFHVLSHGGLAIGVK